MSHPTELEDRELKTAVTYSDPATPHASQEEKLRWHDMFLDMFKAQQAVNDTVANKMGVNWVANAKNGDWDYLAAGAFELIELANSHEDWWKWWVNQAKPIDEMNVKIELVDAFHFFMAFELAHWINRDDLASDYVREYEIAKLDFRRNGFKVDAPLGDKKESMRLLKTVVSDATNTRLKASFAVTEFFRLCLHCGLDIDLLYTIYTAKSVLNRFRQKHGYKEGTYMKQWGNYEDNFYLMSWLTNTTFAKGEPTQEQIFDFLETKYNQAKVDQAYAR